MRIREKKAPRWKEWINAPYLVVSCRLLVGSVFLVAGLLKLLAPPEEFAALMRDYQVIPAILIQPLSLLLPWIEFLSGSLLCAGLFTRIVAFAVILQLLSFLGVISLVLLLGIPLEDCGCFGGIGFSETPRQVWIRDAVFLSLMLLVVRHPVSPWSLDHWFARN